MGQTVINISIDEDLKNEFEDVCTKMGLSISSAINLFAKTVVREKRFPIDLRYIEPSKEEVLSALEQLHKDAELNGTSNMTMAEIDEEIRKTREEKHLR